APPSRHSSRHRRRPPPRPGSPSLFFFRPTATPAIYTLSLHDALPICLRHFGAPRRVERRPADLVALHVFPLPRYEVRWTTLDPRSEEHTSELQSRRDLVCRLLLEKKKIEAKTDADDAAEDTDSPQR